MSRYHPRGNKEAIFEAAATWKERALLEQGSVFTSSEIWTPGNLTMLRRHFVDQPDAGDGSFLEKLEKQLSETGKGPKQLAAEMTWFMLLCPSRTKPSSKRETIRTIWSWSGDSFPDSPLMSDVVLSGLGSAGTAFNTQRWRELRFFVHLMQQLRARSPEDVRALLADGWKFAEWLESVPEASTRQLRHMVLHLLFPVEFERIFGGRDRRKVVRAFTGFSQSRIAALTPLEVDRSLFSIRAQQEEKHHTKQLDFYEPPLRDLWQQSALGGEEPTTSEADTEFDDIASRIQAAHVRQAIETIEREGTGSTDSSTYDLIAGAKRYSPERVFAIAAKHATGAEFFGLDVDGYDPTRCFKTLQDLGFSIERKTFVPELIDRFVKQADEGGLTVADYPKSYRELRVNVSFGKGNVARIPWISFTAYQQTTSDGIYPVLLYYRAINRLVVAYGISETNAPKSTWSLPAQRETIATAFEQQGLPAPDRYGASLVHSVFDISEGMDLEEIGRSLDEVIADYYLQFGRKDRSEGVPPAVKEPPAATYTIEEALKDLFIDEQDLNSMLNLLRAKKNVILQGPPGVGKTYVCKRLAFALMGEKAPARFQMVQFHQSYSYEDFIQGFRPSSQGVFRLKNGLFYEFCDRARDDPGNKYVFAIDEINRGNLSKVFGEVMMLIESDKRGPEWSVPLTYSEQGTDVFYVPENVYLIGMMNTADRSLAMVDYALRRRFGFIDLEPQFDSEEFRAYLEEKGADTAFAEALIRRMSELNAQIADDVSNLGPGYCIGHSYFSAIQSGTVPDWVWFKQIIEAEIAPLLKEYYFDNRPKVEEMLNRLQRRE